MFLRLQVCLTICLKEKMLFHNTSGLKELISVYHGDGQFRDTEISIISVV